MIFEIVYNRKKIASIGLDKVDYIAASDKYLEIFSEGKSYIWEGTLCALLEKYPDLFVEVRRGTIVKRSLVRGYFSMGRGYRALVFVPGIQYSPIMIGRRKQKSIKADFDKVKPTAAEQAFAAAAMTIA